MGSVMVQALLLRRSTFIMLAVLIPPHCWTQCLSRSYLGKGEYFFLWLSVRGHRLHHNTEGMAAERKHLHPRSRKLTSRPYPTDLLRGPSPQPSQRDTPAENQKKCWAKLNSGVNSGLIIPRVDLVPDHISRGSEKWNPESWTPHPSAKKSASSEAVS